MTTEVLPAAGVRPWWQRVLADAWAVLPRGGALSPESWAARHRGICALLWVHVLVLPLVAVVKEEPVAYAVLEAAVVSVFAVGAELRRLSPLTRSAMATLGLVSSSAILVHLFNGLIEMHFHFFVMVAVIALYQAWQPFLLALGYVVFHHTVIGILAPEQVYNHGSALHNPALFALVHGGFVLGESVACLVYWRFSEDALNGERTARVQLEKAHGDLIQAQELSAMGSWDWDIPSNTVTWSNQLYALTAVDPSTFTPAVDSFLSLVHPDDHDRVADLISAAVETRTELDYECRLARPDGEIRTMHALGEWVIDASGEATRMFGTLHDVTERSRMLVEIEHLAFHDPLTGLANRRLFLDRLGHALAVTERSGLSCAVLFMDLDGFKKINDTFGHSVGDEILCEVGRRLTHVAREVDTIARFGGDEFAVLCEGIDLEMAIRVAKRIDEQLHQPIEFEGADVVVRGSIGIALAEGSLSTEVILRKADAAMYAVKSGGRAAIGSSA